MAIQWKREWLSIRDLNHSRYRSARQLAGPSPVAFFGQPRVRGRLRGVVAGRVAGHPSLGGAWAWRLRPVRRPCAQRRQMTQCARIDAALEHHHAPPGTRNRPSANDRTRASQCVQLHMGSSPVRLQPDLLLADAACRSLRRMARQLVAQPTGRGPEHSTCSGSRPVSSCSSRYMASTGVSSVFMPLAGTANHRRTRRARTPGRPAASAQCRRSVDSRPDRSRCGL